MVLETGWNNPENMPGKTKFESLKLETQWVYLDSEMTLFLRSSQI